MVEKAKVVGLRKDVELSATETKTEDGTATLMDKLEFSATDTRTEDGAATLVDELELLTALETATFDQELLVW